MKKVITAKAVVENVPVITDMAAEALESVDCPMKTMVQLQIVLDEIISNIARYAYKGTETGDLTVILEVEGEPSVASVTFIDEGRPYDPLAKEDPDITLSADEREIGGLGIFMVKKTMDSMTYERRDNRNVLTVTKKL